MSRITIILTIISFWSAAVFGQASNGKVSSLVAAENYFSTLVKEKGIKEAFLKVSDDETLIFRPEPVKASEYFEEIEEISAELIWEPVYAKISKSGDWGFTSGPSIYSDSSVVDHGQYLSVWKTNRRGVWKLALDLGISHPKPKSIPDLNFRDPETFKYSVNRSASRTKQREDLILTTDRLYSTTRKINPEFAFNDYFTTESRVFFPGYEPIIGRKNVAAFFKKNGLNIHSEVSDADRATASDFAYTYGTAKISTKDSVKDYSYVRIWENQEGKWNVLVEAFVN